MSDHPHTRIAVESTCLDCGKQVGHAEFDRVSSRELANESAAALPERDAMSLVNANLAIPINIAAALNVLSDGSIAFADASQTTPIDQSTAILPPA